MARLVEENCVFLESDATCFDEVIKLVGNGFLENGAVKDTYINAVIEREKVFPTGLPADGMNIAMPHTDSEHVNQASIGVVVAKNPISVAMMGSPDVQLDCKVFFVLAMQHPHEQMGLLKQLMKFFQDKEKLNAIANATSAVDVQTIMSTIEL